mmetsp:Transcript_58282/g.92618  ORF Transcript_58282/g.92618 Transcript_58282/m.92618 type:complete len:711 (+) Transcript_58282:282-2414(+)|eukprot:CAMPEP_0197022492 /NCGR_PEP_ID=MMETSP1384-20130603/3353_1 /TAXON_ID=29189 /ORGANISM="Ammonia sp." /LENGTH=710 /DNA_ID=CAMNT_0042450547 /DNA_START=241 /DNA_END=2373 /DNA_ORIENTATION=+
MEQVGADQYIPDEMEDNTLGFGSSPGGDLDNGGYQQPQKQTAGGGNGVIMTESTELNESQKLQLAERANEIYRQQLKYMQDHLASLRSLIQDKENIIENLMLRYDLGIITQDQNRTGGNLSSDEMEMEELRRKAEALAQRTILENFELREMVNELRDENFHLRNEIYELQDKINRQVLQINKLEKQAASNNASNNAASQQPAQRNNVATGMDNMYGDDDNNDDDIYGDVEEDENNDDQYSEDAPQSNTDNRAHDRYSSISGNDWLNDSTQTRASGRRQSRTMDPAQTDEAVQKRQEREQKGRRESVPTPAIFGDQQDDSEDDDHPEAQTEEARRKREERANKTRKESVAAPDMFGDAQGESEEDDGDDDVGDATLGTKRRGSQVYMDEAAKQKRQQRQNHRRGSSVAAPNIFSDNYDPEKVLAAKNSPQATEKRMQRKAKKVARAAVQHVVKHRRKESLAEKLLLGPIDQEDDELDLKTADPEERKRIQAQARKEQRRKSRQLIKQQVGAKEHFSDDDVTEDKPQRAGLKARKKSSQRQGNAEDELEMAAPQQNNKKRRSVKADVAPLSAVEEKPKHRRDSSAPVPDLGFEDPEVVMHYQKLKVEDLEKELESKLDELDRVKHERDQLLAQIEIKSNTANDALQKQQTVESELNAAVQSKADLAAKCSMEIMRLTMILNALQQMPKIKDVVAVLLDESNNDTKKNGSLLG